MDWTAVHAVLPFFISNFFPFSYGHAPRAREESATHDAVGKCRKNAVGVFAYVGRQ